MSDSPAMYQTEMVPLGQIKRAPYNEKVRKIRAPRLEALAKSIGEFGLVEPIVVNKRTMHVVGGHQRLTVLQRQKVKEAPVIFVDLDDTHEKALNVALNSPELQGEFTDDLDSLLKEIKPVPGADVSDVSDALFTDLRLDALVPPTPIAAASKEKVAKSFWSRIGAGADGGVPFIFGEMQLRLPVALHDQFRALAPKRFEELRPWLEEKLSAIIRDSGR